MFVSVRVCYCSCLLMFVFVNVRVCYCSCLLVFVFVIVRVSSRTRIGAGTYGFTL